VGAIRDLGQRMSWLERGMMPRVRALERLQRLVICSREILHAAKLLEPGMARPDTGIIEARPRWNARPEICPSSFCADRCDAVEHARPSARERARMHGPVSSQAARLGREMAICV